MSLALELRGVVKRHRGGDRPALDGLDLDLAAGGTLALLGPNGAGKSTLVSLAVGLARPDDGIVRVLGSDPAARSGATRRQIGVAPQEIGVYPQLSVTTNLRAFAELYGLNPRVARARARELLEPFALTELASRPAGRLSGGEQRRLHAAIALVHRPRLVLLDEPTAGADPSTREHILQAVRDLARAGTAVVYTTHYLPEVERLDADIALLERGRLIARGSLHELLARHVPPPAAPVAPVAPPRASLESVYLALTGRATLEPAEVGVVSPLRAVVRNELRILRHDPVPLVLLIAMPVVLMALLSQSLGHVLLFEGYDDAPGSMHTAPGMACLFGFFSIAIVGFAIFREHGWKTWPRLRAAGISGPALLAGKLVVPAGMLVLQHVVLFGFGVLALDFEVDGAWLAVVLLAFAFASMVLSAGLAAAAALQTVQQLNAVTNLGTMVLGGLGGALVPVRELPKWVQPLAPVSPVNWAMEGYREVILDGGGLRDVLPSLAGMVALSVALLAFALWRLRLDAPKRTWG